MRSYLTEGKTVVGMLCSNMPMEKDEYETLFQQEQYLP